MKNLYISLFLLLSLSILLLSFSKAEKRGLTAMPVKNDSIAIVAKDDSKHSELSLYESLQLNQSGLSKETFKYAIKGYENLISTSAIKDTQYLSVVDFSQSSRKKRFYLFDFKNHKLLKNTFVAHGKNSGVDMATRFSNIPGSEQSSLGFYLTKGTYIGKNGFSLKMSGLEKKFNDNAEKRAIVVHGADYVNASRVQSDYMGRSQGCPALPRAEATEIIDLIKDGSALFVYYPSKEYLQFSNLLNS